MPDYGPAALDVLAPVIAAARRALARLDDEELPSSVQRVAAYSGGRLPPPLVRRLVDTLEKDEWLRSKVADELDDDQQPAALFVTRPEGWWVGFAAAVESAAAQRVATELHKAGERIDKLERQVAKAKQKGKSLTEQRAGEHEKQARTIAEVEKRLQAEVEAAERRLAEADAKLDEQVGNLEALREAHEDSQRQLVRMRERVRKIRAERPSSDDGAASGLSRSPVELARHLDILAQFSAPRAGVPATPTAAAAAAPAQLPKGMSPDSAQAIAWLIRRTEPFTLVIDGYNVLFLLDPDDFASGSARQRLNHALNRLRRQAKTSPRTIAVYDSSLPGERDVATAGSIEVVFAHEDRLADEEVIAIAQELTGPVVVVSTDREVREGAEAAGAVALWSESLVAWVRSSS